MARRPRAPRIEPEEEFVVDPINETVLQDRAETAVDLSEILDALRGYDQGTIKGVLYRKPLASGGKYEWIEECVPPFDFATMFAELKDRFGGGDFQLRIFAGGRIRKNVDFSIAKEKNPLIVEKKDSSDTAAMFQMMMNMQMEAGREARAASDRMMQMMMQSQQTTTQLMIAAMGGREKAADFIPLIAAMKGDAPSGNPMKEAIETLTAAKGLFGGNDGGGFNPDDLVGSALKVAGPVMAAVGKAVEQRRGQAAEDAGQLPAPQPGPLMLAGGGMNAAHDPALASLAGPSRYPVLDLVRDDVLFMFRRGHDPQRAAEVVFDTIDAHNVSDDAINELVLAFTTSADPLADLAAEGIDLRSRPDWAQGFLTALVALHADAGGSGDDPQRGGGSGADAGDHGQAGAGGLAADRSS